MTQKMASVMLLALLSAPIPAIAQSPPQPPPPPVCDSPVHGHFDFWLGKWNVTFSGPKAPKAVNVVTREHRGCVVREDYRTATGYTGMSMSFYDPADRLWHQVWVGMDGSPLHLAGQLDAQGNMVLRSDIGGGQAASATINRVMWYPLPGGSVRQHWEASSDGRQTWTTVSDGLYQRMPE